VIRQTWAGNCFAEVSHHKQEVALIEVLQNEQQKEGMVEAHRTP
jgi:hypothetical protein